MGAISPVHKRLAELGVALPASVEPLGNYVGGVQAGTLLFLSGRGPIRKDGKPAFRGQVGRDFTVEEARAIAEGATLNVLSSAQAILGGLEAVQQVVKASIFVACSTAEADANTVADGCSNLLTKLFGAHVRTVLRAASLPNDVPVLVEAILEIRQRAPAGLHPLLQPLTQALTNSASRLRKLDGTQ